MATRSNYSKFRKFQHAPINEEIENKKFWERVRDLTIFEKSREFGNEIGKFGKDIEEFMVLYKEVIGTRKKYSQYTTEERNKMFLKMCEIVGVSVPQTICENKFYLATVKLGIMESVHLSNNVN